MIMFVMNSIVGLGLIFGVYVGIPFLLDKFIIGTKNDGRLIMDVIETNDK